MNFKHNFHRLKKLSKKDLPAVLLHKVAEKTTTLLEKWVSSPEAIPSRPEQQPAKKMNALGLVHIDALTPGFGELFKEAFASDAQELVAKADDICELIIPILGLGPVDLKQFRDRKDLTWSRNGKLEKDASVEGRIPWHFDVKSGVGWSSQVFFSDIKFGNQDGVDVLVPWRLSRCSHFVVLGQAYRLTHQEKYVETFINQIDDWLNQNPTNFGVNWKSSMDVALRACNWILAWELMKDSPTLKKPIVDRISVSLEEHARHIERHLEWSGAVSMNHYLSNLLGLAYIGKVLDEKKWSQKANIELAKEIKKQVYDDGMDFEASLPYHKLSLEMFFYWVLIQPKENRPDPVLKRLKSMFQTLIDLSDSEGKISLLGDNDSSRVHNLFERNDFDARPLIQMGGLFFGEKSLKCDEWETLSELVWFFGFSGKESFSAFPGTKNVDREARGPSASGLITLRGKDDFLLFVAQPNGTRGVGNHTHNDKLSFTLSYGGETFFVDPGSGVYTSDPQLRSMLRSTSMHNTVEIDGEDQNEAVSLFSLSDDAKVHVDDWKQNKSVLAHHTGYKRLASPVVHKREIIRKADPLSWQLKDEFKGTGEHRLKWSFVLGPEIKIKEVSEKKIELIGNKSKLEIAFEDRDKAFQVEEGLFSSSYGKIEKTTVLRILSVVKLPHVFSFSIKVGEK